MLSIWNDIFYVSIDRHRHSQSHRSQRSSHVWDKLKYFLSLYLFPYKILATFAAVEIVDFYMLWDQILMELASATRFTLLFVKFPFH